MPWVSILSRGWTGLSGEAERPWNIGPHGSDLRPLALRPSGLAAWDSAALSTSLQRRCGMALVSVISSEVLMPG